MNRQQGHLDQGVENGCNLQAQPVQIPTGQPGVIRKNLSPTVTRGSSPTRMILLIKSKARTLPVPQVFIEGHPK